MRTILPMRYGHLCAFLEAKRVILGVINFLFGLPINLIVIGVDILKNVAKTANLRPKIGQIPLLSLDIIGHNSIIFYPILTFFISNCLFLGDESILVFCPFLLRGLTWVKLCAWTQNQPKKVGTCPGLPLQPVSHLQNYRPESPLNVTYEQNKFGQNRQLSAQNRPTAILAGDLLISITRSFSIQF